MMAQDPITDLRKAFKRDLTSFLQQCQSQGEEIILVGDFNETRGEDIDGIATIASSCGLGNIMSARHSGQPPATFARGRQCIDYGFASLHVIQSIRKCGYEQFSARFPTDHRAYFFDFDTDKLFGTRTPKLATHAKRILKSNNIRQVTQYIKEKYEYLQRWNAFNRAKQLTHPENCHQYAERLDKDMLQASLVAEQRTQRYGEPAWSVALDQARKCVAILKKCLTMSRTRLDLNEAIQ